MVKQTSQVYTSGGNGILLEKSTVKPVVAARETTSEKEKACIWQ